MSSRAVVLGAGGYLGRCLLEAYPGDLMPGPRFKATTATDLANVEKTLDNFLREESTHALVNCIGLREGTDAELTLANQYVPRIIANVARARSLRLVHIGSAAELLVAREGVNEEAARPLLRYSESKKAGTREALGHANALVARIHNLHGLPHQSSSGLHTLCLAVRGVTEGQQSPESSVVNVSRDYIHRQLALEKVRALVDDGEVGVVEIRSHISVSLRSIVEHLPTRLQSQLLLRLSPPDILSDVLSSHGSLSTPRSISLKAAELAGEVIECASS